MAEPVTEIRPNVPLPVEVTLGRSDRSVRFTPRELEMIKARFDRSMSQLVDDDDSDDKLIVLAWLKLRRDGYALDLEEMADIVISLEGETAQDPSSGEPTPTSPPSVSTSG